MRKKSRIHTVNLSEPAEFIYNQVNKKYGSFGWFSQWVSQKLIAEFMDKDMDRSYKLFKVGELNVQHEKILKEIESIAEDLEKMSEKVQA